MLSNISWLAVSQCLDKETEAQTSKIPRKKVVQRHALLPVLFFMQVISFWNSTMDARYAFKASNLAVPFEEVGDEQGLPRSIAATAITAL